MIVGVAVGVGAGMQSGASGPASGPTIDTAGSLDVSTFKIGTEHTITAGTASATGGGSVTYEYRWLVAGVSDASTAAYTPQAANDEDTIAAQWRAVETGGTNDGATAWQTVGSGTITYPAPAASGSVPAQSWTIDVDPGTLAMSSYFTGSGITYSITSGALPTGRTLNTSTGDITGTPSVDDGTSPVVVTATNSGGSDTQSVAFTVTQPQITATLTPAMSPLYAGQAVQDVTNYSTMVSTGNFSTNVPGESIASAIVSFTGAATSASDPLAEDDLAGFTVTVTDSVGTVTVFDAGQITVEYKVRVNATAGNEADIDINDLVPDAEVLSITIDSGPYTGTYTPTAGDLRDNAYNFAGTIDITGTTAVDDVLTADDGLWSSPTGSLTLTRNFQADSGGNGTFADISGANGTTYTITSDEQGDDMRLRVRGDDGTNPPVDAYGPSPAISIPAAGGSATLTEIGTLRSSTITAAITVSETIDTGAAEAGKRLIVEMVWGDADGSSTTVLSATVGGTAMTKEVEVLDQRQNITILSFDVSAGGNVLFEAVPSGGTAWRGYSYRVFLLTGHTAITPLSDTGTVADTLDLSANVLANDIMIGGSMLENQQTTGDVTFTGLTEAHEFVGQAGKLHHHFGATISANASPRTMTLSVTGDATGVFVAAAILIR